MSESLGLWIGLSGWLLRTLSYSRRENQEIVNVEKFHEQFFANVVHNFFPVIINFWPKETFASSVTMSSAREVEFVLLSLWSILLIRVFNVFTMMFWPWWDDIEHNNIYKIENYFSQIDNLLLTSFSAIAFAPFRLFFPLHHQSFFCW